MKNRRFRLAAVLLAAVIAVSLPAITADAASQFGFVSTIGSFLGLESPESPVVEAAVPDTHGIDAVNSITALGIAFTENFDSMGFFQSAALPDGFAHSGVLTFTNVWNEDQIGTSQWAGTTGIGALTGTSTAGVYNFADGLRDSSTDRSLGILNSGSFTSPRSLFLRITNNTGSTIGSLDIAFDYEKYRSGSRAFDWTFFHGSTTAPATAATAGDQSYAADANNTTVFNPPTTISKSFTLSGLNIPNGSHYYLRWTLTGVGGSTNGQGLGIDNLGITAYGVPPVCPAGSWYNGTSCVAASPGFFVPTSGATSQTPCSAGTYQPNSGSTSCLFAPAGTFVSTTAATSPTLCSAGTFQPNVGQASCILAPAGTFVSTTGATAPTQCPSGRYQPNTGQTSCILASPGNFVATSGATSQTQCPVGTFQPNSGATSCLFAPAGSFVSTTGATASTQCAAGSYQPNTGQSSCMLASPGFYVPDPGATAQIACPAGTTSGTGATACTPLASPPIVSTDAATSVTATSATLNGTANPNGDAATGWFRYSTVSPGTCNDSFGTRAPSTGGTSLGSGTSGVPYSFGITGLVAGTQYFFCAIAQNSGGTSFGAVQTFTPVGPPTVTTNAATSVTAITATVSGLATPNGSATTAWFRYSATDPGTCNDTFGTRAPTTGGASLGSGTSPTAYNRSITGLIPATTYYFCAIAQNAEGTSFGSVLSFTTLANAPTVGTSAANGFVSGGATLNGFANPGGAATTGWFRYSTTNPGTCNDSFGTRAPLSGGTSLGSGTTSGPFSQSITGLVTGTIYFYCAIAENSIGKSFGTVMGLIAQDAPTVTTNAATAVTASVATLNGAANPNGSATTGWFRYSTTDPGTCNDTFGTRAPTSGGSSLGSGTSLANYSQAIAGLAPATTYYYCAIASNAIGTEFGSVLSFTTNALPPTVSTSAATLVTNSSAQLNGSANPGGAETTGWYRYATASPGTCNDSFGTRAPSTGGTSLGSGTTSVGYSQAITGLSASTTYYFCAIAQNSEGTSFGAVQQFTTTAPPPAVQFAASTFMDDESQSAVITVTRTGSLAVASSVDVVLTDGTATGGADCTTSGVDYVYTGPVTLNFAINDDSESFSVPLCGDVINEGTETVDLSLTSNVNADIGSPNTAVLLINDTASQFRNATAIDMFLGTAGSPNPSTINVTGGPTVIGSMRVTLYDLSHDIPDNIDILLIGPNGAKYVLMGDTGGPFTIDVNSPVTLSFTDSAAAVLPDSNVLTTGTYLPTTCETPVTNFAGAPAGPYIEPGCVVSRPVTQTMFGAFGLTSPMGNWNLYVRDDNGSPLTMTAIGSIAGGWGLEFLPPTAAGVEVSGRVLTSDGRGLRNATVTMTDGQGVTRSAVTSSFGYYRFEGVPVGDSFVMTVNSRSYRFVPRVVTVTDTLTDVDFVGLE
ncbi:MAG: carboxypeptidase regulatory-like domain-containing protein [Acidobacteriota bacterium]|nr:MAG: carboxypeptidase regulatory-like domain-containing protein [Acidobacteriota bacterium]